MTLLIFISVDEMKIEYVNETPRIIYCEDTPDEDTTSQDDDYEESSDQYDSEEYEREQYMKQYDYLEYTVNAPVTSEKSSEDLTDQGNIYKSGAKKILV